MKKILIVFLVALALGGGIAFYIFNKIVIEGDDKGVSVSVKAFQIGAFSNYDNAFRVAERNNGIVVSDEDIFRVYVAILGNEKAITKLGSYYDSIGLNYYLKNVNVSKDFYSSIKDTEELLINGSSDTYNIINTSVLERYEEFL